MDQRFRCHSGRHDLLTVTAATPFRALALSMPATCSSIIHQAAPGTRRRSPRITPRTSDLAYGITIHCLPVGEVRHASIPWVSRPLRRNVLPYQQAAKLPGRTSGDVPESAQWDAIALIPANHEAELLGRIFPVLPCAAFAFS